MAVKQIFNDALQTPMTRKEFLGQIGALLLAVIGVTSILHVLGGGTGGHRLNDAASESKSYGYGTSAYGGRRLV